MDIIIRGNFRKEDTAKLISAIIMGQEVEGIPYTTVPSEENSWVLNRGNDWWLEFVGGDPDHLRIAYRYQRSNCKKEEALIGWLKEVFGV